MEYFYSLSDYLINTYGHKIYKLSLSCSNTCPNRDGSKGTGGCIFCSQKGSGDFASDIEYDIDTQIENAKKYVSKKYKGNTYIAYFQSFTSTYGNINDLEKIFTHTIKRDDIEILSIATRPDCLDDNVFSLLERLNRIKPVWVELGLQTLNEKTAEYINRCYKNETYFKAVEDLHKININVITHLILGLPDETADDMINTAKTAGSITDGVKFTVLHVLKNTALEKIYNDGRYSAMSLDEYVDMLSRCISVIPEDKVIHRITGDGNKRELIAPKWTENKKYVLQYIYDHFKNNSIRQGQDLLL